MKRLQDPIAADVKSIQAALDSAKPDAQRIPEIYADHADRRVFHPQFSFENEEKSEHEKPYKAPCTEICKLFDVPSQGLKFNEQLENLKLA